MQDIISTRQIKNYRNNKYTIIMKFKGKYIRRTRVKRQQGGRKVGEGGFGCIVGPAIPCSQTKKYKADSISKIIHVRDQEDYKQELHIYDLARKVDPQQKYILGIREECLLDIPTALARQPRDIIEAQFTDAKHKGKEYTIIDPGYTHLNNNNVRKSYCKLDRTLKPRNIIMDYGGIDLYDIITNTYSEEFYLCQKFATQIFKNILIAIKLLHSTKVVHRDIKPENLIYKPVKKIDKKKRRVILFPMVRVIDLGLAEDISRLDGKNASIRNVTHRGTSGYIPLEIDMLEYIYTLSESYDINEPVFKKSVVKDALDTYKDSGLSHAYYLTATDLQIDSDYESSNTAEHTEKLKQARIDTEKLFDKFKLELETNQLPGKYFKQYDGYVYKTDVFALGLTIEKIAKKLHVLNDKTADLIKHMTEFDPDKRYNIHDCLKHPLFASKKK